jgi:hypothetical protein
MLTYSLRCSRAIVDLLVTSVHCLPCLVGAHARNSKPTSDGCVSCKMTFIMLFLQRRYFSAMNVILVIAQVVVAVSKGGNVSLQVRPARCDGHG